MSALDGLSAQTLLTRSNAKLTLSPVDHFAGARFSRRTWRAAVEPVCEDQDLPTYLCPHDHGHRTIEAGKSCARKMWKKLPDAVGVTS